MSEASLDISVVCCTHNRVDFVRRHYAMLRNRVTASCEILYVLDHCTDATLTYLQSVAADDRRLRFFENSGPQGLFSSRNAAIGQARGRYIHYLDDDDSVSDGFYAGLDALIGSDLEPDMLLTDLVLDHEGQVPRRLRIVDEARVQSTKVGATTVIAGDLFDHILHGNLYFVPANTLIRRSILQTRPFRADIRKSADWLLYLEISHSRPLRLVHLPTVYATYWVHNSSMSMGGDKSYWNMKAFEALHDKLPPTDRHGPAVRKVFAKSLFDAGYAVRRKDKGAAARYYWHAARHGLALPSVLAIVKLALVRRSSN